MTVPGHDAAARRERLLRRTRTITLGIAGGAAVASLGLGTALAHVTPGHGRPAAAGHATATRPASGPATAPRATSGPAPAGRAAAAGTPPAPGPPPARAPHHRHRLAPPAAPPAPAPAAPQASSGGS
jgi:hypothetical protein